MNTDHWTRKVTLFLAVTFGIAWGVFLLLALFPAWMEAHFGAMSARNPLFYLAVWAPNIAALVTVFVFGGRAGLIDLFLRLIRWRVPLWVWVAAFGFYPALMLVVQLIQNPGGGMSAWWLGLAAGLVSLPALALGPLGEELGWRGTLLPLVLGRTNAFVAALVVGAVWMAWHLPAFFVSGLPQDGMVISMFMVGGIALSVFVTWLFVNARGGIFIAGIVPHAVVNAYGDATGAMSWVQVSVLVVAAVLLVGVLGANLRPRRIVPAI